MPCLPLPYNTLHSVMMLMAIDDCGRQENVLNDMDITLQFGQNSPPILGLK